MSELFSDRGFVLHSRRYRENSRIVEVFTREHGRIALVARIRPGKSGRDLAALQPWCESGFFWRGRHELQNLASIEALRNHTLAGENSICGLYCNELLLHLLAKRLPSPETYDCYGETIAALADGAKAATLLRRFEEVLLRQLGFALDYTVLTKDAARRRATYYFHPEHGLTEEPLANGSISFSAAALDGLMHRNFSDRRTASAAKSIFGATIHVLLDGRQLRSRKLLQSYKRYQP